VHRTAVSVVFFLNGLVFANWVTRIPAVSDRTHASPAQLGLALLCIAIGSIAAMALIGRVVDRRGSRPVILVTGLLTAAALPLPGAVDSVVALGGALLLYGAAVGALDVAMNVSAMQVVRVAGPVMPSFHAAFSLGGLVGAGTGALAATASMPPATHLALVALATAVGVLAVRGGLPDDLPEQAAPEDASTSVWRTPAVWLFGIIALCGAFSEGAIADWTALYLRDEAGAGEGPAALGYAGFSLTMTAARLAGGQVLTRLGRARTLTGSGLLAAGGVLLAVLVPGPAAFAGFSLAGLGLALAFPVALQGGAEAVPGANGRGVAAVSVVGYAGFLSGPPLIGFLAEAVSLRGALITVVALSLLAAGLGSRAPAAPGRVASRTPTTVEP
jgi:MFS family permease